MTDLNEWLKERRTIHDAATEGRWHKLTRTDEGPAVVTDRSGMLPPEWVAYAGMCSGEDDENARAIVDAHNTLPALLTAVEKVLEAIAQIDREYSKAPGENAYADGMCDAAYMFDKALSEAIEGAINHE